jgi:hypothetical protein
VAWPCRICIGVVACVLLCIACGKEKGSFPYERWLELRVGLQENEVVDLLGTPRSAIRHGVEMTLFYAPPSDTPAPASRGLVPRDSIIVTWDGKVVDWMVGYVDAGPGQ